MLSAAAAVDAMARHRIMLIRLNLILTTLLYGGGSLNSRQGLAHTGRKLSSVTAALE
jgi:hypothetical protein